MTSSQTLSQPSSRHETWLRRVLGANAVFSGLTGLEAVFAPAFFGELIGLPAAEIRVLGVQLLAFAAFLAFLVTRQSPSRSWVRHTVLAVIVMDFLWVLASVYLLFLADPGFTSAGRWIVGAQALAVDVFATAQLWAWRGMGRSPGHVEARTPGARVAAG